MASHGNSDVVMALKMSSPQRNVLKKGGDGVFGSLGGGWSMEVLVEMQGYEIIQDNIGLRDVDRT